MSDSMGYDAELSLDSSKAVRGSAEAAAAVDELNRSLVALGRQLQTAQRAYDSAFKQQATGQQLKPIVDGLKAQGVAQDEVAGKTAALNAAELKLAQDRDKQFAARNSQLASQAAATQRFNAYTQSSNERVAKSEAAALKQSTTQTQAWATSRTRDMMAAATQQNRIFNDQQRQFAASAQAQQRYAQEAAKAKVSYGQQLPQQSLITQRYALYDVAQTWGMVSTALLGADAAAAKVSIDFETAFAQVERTTQVSGAAATELKTQLEDLSTTLPTTFANISDIAALGGQLGISAAGIGDFTKTVAELTATTDLSSQAAGTALGRFQALLGVPSSKFEALGSSILKVGVNSVATESQIVNVATQISSMGQFAGLTADQVVGLSGALASVGAAPELSRGTITRTFSQMQKAVSDGGEKLKIFAAIAGVSAQEFSAAWGTDKFAGIFQKFLAGVGNSGNQAISMLNAVGISSVRDVPLLMRLGAAGDVVNNAFRDAATGYADNTELSKQYGIIAETTAAKLSRLGNTIKAIIDAGSSSTNLGPLKAVLDFVQGLAGALLTLARTPIGQFMFGLAAAVALVVGGLAAWRAVQALTIASMYAMQTASDALAGSITKQNGGMKSTVVLLGQMLLGLNRVSAAEAETAATTSATAASMETGAVGARTLGTALKGIGTSLGWTALLVGATALLSKWGEAQARAKQNTDDFKSSLDSATGALTQNTQELIVNTLRQQGIDTLANKAGASFDTVIRAAFGQKEALAQLTAEYNKYNDAANAYDGSNEAGLKAWGENKAKATEYGKILSALGATTGEVADAQRKWREEQAAGMHTSDQAATSTEDLNAALSDLVSGYTDGQDATVKMQDAIYALGSSLGENGASFDIYSANGRANFEALQQVISAMVTAAGGDSQTLAVLLGGLMQQLSGYGSDAVNQLGFVQTMISQLTGGKGVSGMPGLALSSQQAGSALSQGFSSGAKKAAKSASSTQKEVKTLTDYVNDLSGVIKTAFDIRFGFAEATDKVAGAYASMADSFAQARRDAADLAQQLSDLYAAQQKLVADRTVMTYQLGVANQYGDTLRATEITADLAQNSSDLAKNQSDVASTTGDLQSAQAKLVADLTGTSAAARDQRDAVLQLVQAYEDQITAYANTGASADQVKAKTAELKTAFMNQMTQLGYNTTQISTYAKAFDDMSAAISRMPKNITVTASTDPAQRAIDEFLAKNTGGRGASAGADFPITSSFDGSAAAKAGRAAVLQANMASLQKQYADAVARGADNIAIRALDQMNAISARLNGGNYATGGFTGMGGKYQPAGIVHKGEYVIPKEMVNQSTGLPYANVLGQLTAGSTSTTNYYSGGFVSSLPTVQLVELMPHQVQQIVDAVSVNVSIDSSTIAGTVNGVNQSNARRGSN